MASEQHGVVSSVAEGFRANAASAAGQSRLGYSSESAIERKSEQMNCPIERWFMSWLIGVIPTLQLRHRFSLRDTTISGSPCTRYVLASFRLPVSTSAGIFSPSREASSILIVSWPVHQSSRTVFRAK